MLPPLKICFAASEATPLAKTGGLADVASALSRHLHRRGQDVRLFLPFYSKISIDDLAVFPVDFIQDVPIQLGSASFEFSAFATSLPNSDVTVYLIRCPDLFHRDGIYTGSDDEAARFVLFSRAVLECCQRMGWAPDVIHCNDWHTALIPFLLRGLYDWDSLFRNSKTLVTIHNIGYQGVFGSGMVDQLGLGQWSHLLDQEDLREGRVNFLRSGLIYADLVSTVSPTYAREIQTDDFGMGLQELLRTRRGSLIGILNGVDYGEWNPATDSQIPFHYSPARIDGKRRNKEYLLRQLGLSGRAEAPLAGIVSRLTHQKGFDLCIDVLDEAIARADLRLVVLGTGEDKYERYFASLQDRFPGRVCYHRGYHDELAHVIEAASDLFLMPSRYEPCGLNQMFSLKYGTIPIVRRTGGLADSVELFDPTTTRGTGFVFEHFTTEGFRWALRYALESYRNKPMWRLLMNNAMSRDFSWETQVERYIQLYGWLSRR